MQPKLYTAKLGLAKALNWTVLGLNIYVPNINSEDHGLPLAKGQVRMTRGHDLIKYETVFCGEYFDI